MTVPHRRLNPLTGEWVLVSPQRLDRPWRGRTEPARSAQGAVYDPGCYLCPGNVRANDVRNPMYTSTFVFDNDFPALMPEDAPAIPEHGHDLLVKENEPGICRVACFSPRHDVSLPQLSPSEALDVVHTWMQQYIELGGVPWVKHVEIFENRGVAAGASNPHPHCQIWANASVPNLPRKEHDSQIGWTSARGGCLLCEYLDVEKTRGERVVWGNGSWTALVPHWATWPYEVLLLPDRHATGLDRLDDREQRGLAEAVQNVVRRYDTLFSAECPYSMGFHQRPTDGAAHEPWHLHAHYYPPVLRSATVHKFMVGYELLAAPQRDLTPELAAAALREAL